jgi:hypothetical protein
VEAGEGLAALGGDEDFDGAGEVEQARGFGLGAHHVWHAVITHRNPFGLIVNVGLWPVAMWVMEVIEDKLDINSNWL